MGFMEAEVFTAHVNSLAMATTANHLILTMLIFVLFIDVSVGQVGVCYGMVGDNLPSAAKTVALYKKHNIRRMRLYEPHHPTLEALCSSRIGVMMGVSHADLPNLANSPEAADAWVRNNILRYPTVSFRDIAVGNEVDPESELAPFVLPAMQNIYRAISAAGLGGQIKVSTSIKTDLLQTSWPPQQGEFKSSVTWYIKPILEFLGDTQTSLLANIYPYFAYMNNRDNINLSFALLQPNSGVVADGVYYDNLYYAILDAVDAAIDRILTASPSLLSFDLKASGKNNNGAKGSESGWSSRHPDHKPTALDDDSFSTVENARIYNNNLMRIVKKGTPRRPHRRLETYIFAMYDENQKTGPEYERHFGIFLPNGQPKYPLRFY